MDGYTATNPAQASQAEPKTPTNSRQPHKTTSCPSVHAHTAWCLASIGVPSKPVRPRGRTDIHFPDPASKQSNSNRSRLRIVECVSPPHRWVSFPGGEMELGVVSMEEGHSGG